MLSNAWMDRANCAGINGFTEMDVLEQIGTCRPCPVRAECRLYARNAGLYGVVAGGVLLAPTKHRGAKAA